LRFGKNADAGTRITVLLGRLEQYHTHAKPVRA
jgi:hypothetical protein